MGASLALAGLSGCSVKPAPPGEIVPYVHQPDDAVPGRPLFYATTMTMAGNAVGLLVESYAGRPTKVEGNPDHPASRGATDIFHQASVLTSLRSRPLADRHVSGRDAHVERRVGCPSPGDREAASAAAGPACGC